MRQANYREDGQFCAGGGKRRTHNLLPTLPSQLSHLVVAFGKVKVQNPLVRENAPANCFVPFLLPLPLLSLPLTDSPLEGGRWSGADKGVVRPVVGFERFEGGERRGRLVAGRR